MSKNIDEILSQKFLQDYIFAISSILETEVTIINTSLVRLASTGEYKDKIGEKIPHTSLFQSIIHSKKYMEAMDVRKDNTCIDCSSFKTCKELANIGFPIFYNEEVVGVIGIIALSKKQHEKLIAQKNKLIDFLKYMSLLLESKLKLELNNKRLENILKFSTKDFYIGNNYKIQKILDLCLKIAKTNSPVVITGESGVGKEEIARYIHACSDRNIRNMISVNCSAIPNELVESVLFGYAEGSFTGAKKEGYIGKFELANKSTIFLDEIGDMPLNIQKKLLRVLQNFKIDKIGSNQEIELDIRVICATNKNLESLIKKGEFREDLYYRLNVISIDIPPIRERKEDILGFFFYFLNYYNKKFNKNIIDISDQVRELLITYEWKGNIREIKNTVEYLENVVESEKIEVDDLPLKFKNNLKNNKNNAPNETNLKNLIESYEKEFLKNLNIEKMSLEEKKKISKKLGISLPSLYRKLNYYKIKI